MSQNLKFLCTLYPSIAEVCRRLGLNRQQFNKYLNGEVRPSRHNLKVICDFFGITESEIHLDNHRLAEIVSLRKRPVITPENQQLLRHVESLYKLSANLDRYVGYYFRYHYSFDHPGFLVKSFARIYENAGQYFWYTAERVHQEAATRRTTMANYRGTLFYLSERIFIIEYHSLLKTSITQLILYPSYYTRLSYLMGVQTGVPSVRGRTPAASTVLLESLGKDIDVKKALRSAGSYHEDSGAIEPTIRNLIRNKISERSFILEATEI
jgi:transcriptional regulator with XRE-family HTH domain